MTEKYSYNIIWVDRLASTNEKMKSLSRNKEVEANAVVIAHDQYLGKGQVGNFWESEKGKNLTFSLLLKPSHIEASNQFAISKAVCLGIVNVFNQFASGFCVKWPNDIYFNNEKIGGILIENSLLSNKIGESVIGIGLNINQTHFVSGAPNPVSLSNITGNFFDLRTVLDDILSSIAYFVSLLENVSGYSKIDNDYMECLFRKGGFYSFKDENGVFEARISGISEFGQLILQNREKKLTTYSFKEVEFIL